MEASNVKVMREALKEFVEYSNLVCKMGMFNRDRLVSITKKAHDAISAPPRNCDRFATAKEAGEAFISEACENPCGNCTVDCHNPLVHECGINWLFAEAKGLVK